MVAIVTNSMQDFRGLAADSREVQPGFLFAALNGTKTNGARFIADAVARGAAGILGEPGLENHVRELGLRFLPAANPRLALSQLAAEFST